MAEKDVAKGSRVPSGSGKQKVKELLEYVEQALTDLRYGQITLTVHDGVVVQIERTERRRLNEIR